ncbi:MAG: dockerin type I domain-containing protein, partial [Bacteroidota bacterium]
EGDVNTDGEVNIQDIQVCVNLILGGQYKKEADLDDNGSVDVEDLQAIVNLILGKNKGEYK